MNEMSADGFADAVQTAARKADHATATAFLNALLREWDGWSLISREKAEQLGMSGTYAHLPLAQSDEALLIEVPHAGRFRRKISLPFLRWDKKTQPREIALAEALTLLVLDPQASPGDPAFQLKLLQRILDSRLGTERAYASCRNNKPADLWSFQDAEQALMSGHPTHPNPRSKDEVDDVSSALYSPELAGKFPLFWVLAARSILVLKDAGKHSAEDYCRDLAQADETLPKSLKVEIPEGFVPVPWHPWQAPRLLADQRVINWIAEGKMIPVGSAGQPFAATASMRGVHAHHAPSMLKFSLSMRLTNSKRVLSRKEVERGIQMCRLLDSPVGTDISRQEPGLHILREPAYAALKAQDGGALEESFVVFRENPFRDPASDGPVMLASLCEERLDERSPLGMLIERRAEKTGEALAASAGEWLAAFVDVAVAPLARVRSRHGLLFGSHQQNMMISLKDGLPSAVWVRDCQGTGHLTTHHDTLERHVPDIGRYSENVAPPALGDGLLCYYVIVNNLMNVVSMLAIDGLLAESAAYAILREKLVAIRDACDADTAFYDMLLEAPTLCSKGNYRTSLSGVNEASGDASGQLASFLEIPNPLSDPEATT
ncbi:IucA/IucC family protein [uncultured Roseibium sp.]|uniref:IucA/IucC family protein n=1 Tax=uncultured Roseibium sp. TaxID=1936171 RepID=UPI002591613B|nr:IucA/IucC family protein [uncultured Roseibium sp.]